MTRRSSRHALAALALFTAAAGAAVAQAPIVLPQQSPKASVSQTVGASELTINYHRPAVNKRKVWGELVPLKEVWRRVEVVEHSGRRVQLIAQRHHERSHLRPLGRRSPAPVRRRVLGHVCRVLACGRGYAVGKR